jgi:hypothetical protein
MERYDGQTLGQDLSLGPSDYEAGVLITVPRLLVINLNVTQHRWKSFVKFPKLEFAPRRIKI